MIPIFKNQNRVFVLTLFVTLSFSLFATKSFSQILNWENLQSNQKHVIYLNLGWDYAFKYELGYSYQLKSKFPILLNASYSMPSGNKVLDDFKVKIGAETCFYQINNFQFRGSLHTIYRRYENPFIRLQNFGTEMKIIFGYYKPKWFVASEIGFDKAIVTHFKHSELYRQNGFEGVKDGWYQPATGGNFSYGIQTGYSFKKSDIIFSLGKTITQDFKTAPLIPYYFQLGYVLKLEGK
jgi:hypothetical protein